MLTYTFFKCNDCKLNLHKKKDAYETRNIFIYYSIKFSSYCDGSSRSLPSHQQWNPRLFRRYTKKSLPLAKEILSHYSFDQCESIIDVGCGPGSLTAHIARRAPKAWVEGMDPSDEMVKFARGYYQDLLFKNLSFKRQEFPETKDSVDFIFSCNAFHLIPKEQQSAILQQFAFCAKKDRTVPLLMIMAAKTNSPQTFERAYGATITMNRWKKLQAVNLDDYFQPHNKETFAQVVENTGFVVKKTEIVDEKIIFSSTRKLGKFVESWMGGFGFVAALPHDEQKQLIKDILSNYILEEKPASNGSIEWRSPRFVVHAEKPKS